MYHYLQRYPPDKKLATPSRAGSVEKPQRPGASPPPLEQCFDDLGKRACSLVFEQGDACPTVSPLYSGLQCPHGFL